MRRRIVSMAAVAGMATAAAFAGTPALAVQSAQGGIVRDTPSQNTPNILDGQVNAVVRVPNTHTMIVGGLFTQVQAPDSTVTETRNHILAFDEITGALSTTFLPALDGEVTTLLLAPDGQSVYVGGFFNTVNGVASQSLARINVTNGELVPGFTAPAMNGRVKDLRLTGGRLWVAGTFSTVAGAARAALFTAHPTTGAVDPYMGLTIAGTHNGGVTQVLKMDVTPDGSRLVGIGNFLTVNGLARRQAFILDLTGPSAAVANWQTNFYATTCSASFDSYMRDLDISPDGKYVVISTTGAYGGENRACDSTARWEIAATGSNLSPTWINNTGGDTTYAVAVTGSAVYTGGHFRWQNNPFAGDRAAGGAVGREGIAALDPTNGLPFTWNPGRTKGVGVFDMLATPSTAARPGLWVGSDTDRIGNFAYRARIALMPLTGGTAVPPNVTGVLPGQVYLAGRLTVLNADDVQTRTYSDPGPAGPTTVMPSSGISWGSARGATMIDGKVYYGWSDGNFYSRTFDGTTFGAQTAVNTHDQLATLTAWHNDVPNIGSMFFDRSLGRLYYTQTNSSSLFYRYFTPENNLVGASRFTASTGVAGLNFSQAGGAFLVNGKLYIASRQDGNLRRVNFSNGVPVAGTVATVSGPAIDNADWRTRALFLSTVGVQAPTNQPPVADSTITCTGFDCAFSGTASSDPDGTITAYHWDFGDGAIGSGPTTSHSYANAGTYQVTLTVTDDKGATNSVTKPVTAVLPDVPISFVGKSSANANATSQQVTVPAGVATGDGLILTATVSNTTATIADPAGWTMVGTQLGNGIQTRIWKRVAAPGEAGTAVTVSISALSKYDVTLLAYHGTAADPVATFASASETVSTGSHVTPSATSATNGWVLSYWADNSSATTAWTAPAGQTVRSTSIGVGGGRICSLVTDSGAVVPAGPVGGLTATANSTSAKATMWTVVLAD